MTELFPDSAGFLDQVVTLEDRIDLSKIKTMLLEVAEAFRLAPFELNQACLSARGRPGASRRSA